MKNDFKDVAKLEALKNHSVSQEMDKTFTSVLKLEDQNLTESTPMSDKSLTDLDELTLDLLDEVEISLSDDDVPPETTSIDEGIELAAMSEEGLELGEISSSINLNESFGDLESLEADAGFSLDQLETTDQDEVFNNLEELDLDQSLAQDPLLDEVPDHTTAAGLKLSEDASTLDLNLGYDSLDLDPEEDLPEGLSASESDSDSDADLSEAAIEKLKEIDAIMELDASQINIKNELQGLSVEDSLDQEHLDFDDMSLEQELVKEKTVPEFKQEVREERKKSTPISRPDILPEKNLSQDFKEISVAYSGEMERMQATISNLRSDREELLAKIQKFEEEKMLQGRQSLSMRAELDEKKIELTIMRKKLNEEISELKDRIKLHDEKKLIWDEKIRLLTAELDKSAQKNKIDVKKVQMRERELEQKLELLKSDAESQIRHRDLKILELKRKIDGMEFDMESITSQEKRSVESRFELEDKLDRAIKTLRNAITVLEDESDHKSAINTLKKNINM